MEKSKHKARAVRRQSVSVNVGKFPRWACLEFFEVPGVASLMCEYGTWRWITREAPQDSVGYCLASASFEELTELFSASGQGWRDMYETYWLPHIRPALQGWPKSRRDTLAHENQLPLEKR